MKKQLLTYATLCGTALLFACASPVPMSSLVVKPTMNVSGASERPDGYYQLGRYYQGQNRLDQAIDAYRKALALDRNFVDAHNALGAAYAEQGRLDEAVTEFKIVVAALPVASYAWNNLGYAYLLQGKPADAIVALDRATAFDLTNQRAWNNLGTALARRGDAAAANDKFARAAELASPASATPPVGSPAGGAIVSPAVTAIASPAAVAVASARAVAVVSPGIVLNSSAAMPAVPMAVSPSGVGDHVALDKPVEAGEPIQLVSQPAASDESMKEAAPLFAAIVDSTGAHELVQLAPNVLELRLAQLPVAAVQTYRLELSNGNGITGMAKRLAEQLVASGVPKARLTNQKPFSQQVTEIQYRDGYADVASSLRSRMPNQPLMIKTVLLRADTDVRVVLGRDLPRDVALTDPAPELMLADAAQGTLNGTD